jgi:two-component sensor histidine kinase
VVDLEADLSQLQDLWRGLLRIDYTLPDQPLIDAPTARALVAIAEEAFANAARHGDAKHVRITIGAQDSPHGWQITVTDDGVGPTNGPRGLGSTVFQDVTAGDWMLTPGSNGGACLTATVPVSRESASLRQAD